MRFDIPQYNEEDFWGRDNAEHSLRIQDEDRHSLYSESLARQLHMHRRVSERSIHVRRVAQFRRNILVGMS